MNTKSQRLRSFAASVTTGIALAACSSLSAQAWITDGTVPFQGLGADVDMQLGSRGGDLDCNSDCVDVAVGSATSGSIALRTDALRGGDGGLLSNAACLSAPPLPNPMQGTGYAVAIVTDPQNPFEGLIASSDPIGQTVLLNGLQTSISSIFAWSLAAADVDGDGFQELIVGNPTTGSNAGSVTAFDIISGGSGPDLVLLWSTTGNNPGDQLGFSVGALRDPIAGIDRVLAGAPGAGYAQVLSSAGVVQHTETGLAGRFGVSVADMGDVDGDFVNDYAIGSAALDSDCGPVYFPLLPAAGPTIPGEVRAVFSTGTTTQFTSPIDLTDDSFGWALCGSEGDPQLPQLLVGAPCQDLTTQGGDGIAYEFFFDPTLQTMRLGGSFLGQTPGERFGYSIASGRNNEIRAIDCPRIAIGAPFADVGTLNRAGRVYAFFDSSQLPINNDCCSNPPCINASWTNPNGSLCAAPTLSSNVGMIDCTVGGTLMFDLSFPTQCLPNPQNSYSFLLLASLDLPSATSSFCLGGLNHPFLPFNADALTRSMALQFPTFLANITQSTPNSSGTITFPIPAGAPCGGIPLTFGALIFESAASSVSSTTPRIVGSSATTVTLL